MSILEDLELMDLLDGLPDDSDFDLNDILFEFSTPGLFAASVEEPKVPEVEEVVEEVIPELPAIEEVIEEVIPEPAIMEKVTEEVIPEVCAEEMLPEEIPEEPEAVLEQEESVELPANTVIADSEDEDFVPSIDFSPAAEDEELALEHNDNTLFGDSLGLCDILYEFGTPVDDEGVKLYSPASQTAVEQVDDDTKVYSPECIAVAEEPETPEATVVFDALDTTEAYESTESTESAPVQTKAPGFFAKAAAAIMGLFASRKAEKVAAPVAEQPVEEDYLTLFTQDLPVEEEELIPVIATADEAEEIASVEESEENALIEYIEEASSEEEPNVSEEPDPTVLIEEDITPVLDEDEIISVLADEEAVSVIDSNVPEEEPEEVPVISAEETEQQELIVTEPEAEELDDSILFSDPLGIDDILFEFGSSPAEEEPETPVLPIADELALSEEDNIKVYVPEESVVDIADNHSDSTVVFDALDLSTEPAPVQPAPVKQSKGPGFLAKAAGLVMGLFASKKAANTAAPAAEQPVEEDYLTLFTQDLPAEEDDLIPVIATADEAVEAASVEEPEVVASVEEEETVSEAELLFLFADEDFAAEDSGLEVENTEESPIEEEPNVAEEPDPTVLIEEDITPVLDEDEIISILADEESVPVIDSNVPAEEPEEVPVISAEETEQQELIVTEPEAEELDDSILFSDSLGIDDILFEFGSSPAEEELESPVLPIADVLELPEEDDIKVYVPEEPVVDIADNHSDSTVVFDALDLSEEPAPVQPAPAKQNKGPGFLAKAAGLVMGLFASKKAANAAAPAALSAASAPSEEDPFANLADLFNETDSDDLSGMDELMLELELQAEREAEREAETAAREAAERLAREEEQRILELEAQRLAQEEADAEAEAKRLKAEEDARIKAETDALLKQLQAEEDERQALAEEELFEWLEASEKRREAAAQMEAIAEEPIAVEPAAVEETTVILEAPVLSDAAAVSDTPVYDFAAVDLPSQTQEYTAPQMNINIEEDVPEEVGDLLEMPDVEQSTAEPVETPEEAAARKKKEEDNLHYKPEESTAKTVTSHIGKRFGAAFTAFTESDDDSDDEEALGPELPANKAYRFFNKYISAYRFRLRVSTILCVILGWISLGLPVFGSLKNPAAAAAMCLMILLTVMLAGADILAVGVRNLIRKRATIHSLVAISCIASVIDAIVIIATKGVSGYLPFCGVSAVSMCFAIYGSLLYCRSQRLNFKTLDRANEPMTISVDYGLVEEDTSTVYRTSGYPEGYIHHSEEEDLSETVFGLMAPIMIPAIPVMTLIAALLSGSFSDFFHILAAMFAAAASFGALIAFPLPYFLVQKELYGTKAAIAGWAGAREIGRVSTMIVTDRDLFPDDTVSIKSVRIVDNVPPQLTLSYMCSVVNRSGSCLVPAFTQLAENNDCDLLDVENFQCHEAGGLSGEIGPDSVLVASHSYMKLQGFRIPARKKDSENALFLAVNGHVIAYIIVDYKPIKSVRAGLQSALRGNTEMIFAARDFNVTPLLISKKFKSATERLRFPSYNQRYEITSQVNSETSACAAVVYRKSFYSYAVVVEKAKYLYNSVSWGVVLSAVSSVMGVLLMFIMALTGGGAAVTVGRLLVFMLLWLIPTLALTVSITK